jgi:hypothetical protein
VNAATDGIFYHGMGMGSGVSPRRLLANVPRFLATPGDWWTWLRGMATAAPTPALAARFSYFTLNHLAWAGFAHEDSALPTTRRHSGGRHAPGGPLVWSRRFPARGFQRRYRRGRLFREWDELRTALAAGARRSEVAVLPCAPLQILEEG